MGTGLQKWESRPALKGKTRSFPFVFSPRQVARELKFSTQSGAQMKFTRLLGFRLFLIVLGAMGIGTAFVTTLTVQWQTKNHMATAVKTAASISDIIKRSTHYSMLLNRREDIYQIISTMGHEPGIDGIRIYNKQGIVSFSTREEEVGNRVNMNAEACTVCHSSDRPPVPPSPQTLSRTFTSPNEYRVLGMITPIYNESSCSSAPCHAHPESQTVLGVLDVMLPLSDLDRAVAESSRDQYAGGLLLFAVVSLVTGLFIWFMVNAPVRRLTEGTQEIVKGNLAHRIPIHSKDEIGVLADSFNHMSKELQRARDEIVEWTRTLEERVEQKTRELQRAQQNMIHVEKMASLGQLAATVAHELNNPLEGVLTYAKLLKKKIRPEPLSEEQTGEIQSELSLIADETARCGNIVKNLLLFSKQKIGDMREEDLRTIVSRSYQLIQHHLRIHNIKPVLELGEQSVSIVCDPQQIEQALVALEINAVEAMPEGGTLTLQLEKAADGKHVHIVVRDTGIGIRTEDLPHVFEPFFTTKEGGKGTGLGLAVAYGIVQRHNGTIDVESNLRTGTTFVISLPAKAVTHEDSSDPIHHVYG